LRRRILTLPLLAGLVLATSASEARAPVKLHSLDVNLPDSSRTLPDGPNVAIVHDNCLGCHSVGMILNQPALPRTAWQAEVAKMRNVYKAPVAEKDVGAIVDYLVAIKASK